MTTKEKAIKLHKKVNSFIISCVGYDGYPLTKAVSPAKYRDGIKEIYFCTNTSSKFVAAIKSNSKANVYFYSQKLLWEGCMLKGNMEIVEDMSVKERFWINAFKNAYPEKSFTDPDFCVLKFTAYSGRYYSMFKPRDFEI